MGRERIFILALCDTKYCRESTTSSFIFYHLFLNSYFLVIHKRQRFFFLLLPCPCVGTVDYFFDGLVLYVRSLFSFILTLAYDFSKLFQFILLYGMDEKGSPPHTHTKSGGDVKSI